MIFKVNSDSKFRRDACIRNDVFAFLPTHWHDTLLFRMNVQETMGWLGS